MYTAQEQIDEAAASSNTELRFLIHSMYSKYAVSVFRIIRAMELSSYAPANKARESAYKELCLVFGNSNIADQILAYYTVAEEECRIKPGAKKDARFARAAEALGAWATTPLMAEIEAEAAFVLWSSTGSWNGAMKLLGFQPLSGDRLKYAKRRYATTHANLDMLPKKYAKRMDDKCIEVLSGIIAESKRTGQWPCENALQPHYRHFKSLKLNDYQKYSEEIREHRARIAQLAREAETDGTPVVTSAVRNQYQNGFVDTGLTNGTTYYYKLFPVTTTGAVNMNTANEAKGVPHPFKTFGAAIDLTNSDPSAAVVYTDDAEGMAGGSGYANRGQGSASNIGGFMTKPQGTSELGFIVKEINYAGTGHFTDRAGLYAESIPLFGGNYTSGDDAGVFAPNVSYPAPNAYAQTSSRLMYL